MRFYTNRPGSGNKMTSHMVVFRMPDNKDRLTGVNGARTLALVDLFQK